MKYLRKLHYAFGVGLNLLFLVGCSSFIATPTAIPPTPTLGVGVPVTEGNWEVTIKNVRQVDKWISYTPKSGYIFLAVDATFHNLDSSQETIVADNSVVIIGADGKSNPAVGFGIPNNSHIDTMNGKKDLAGVTGGMGAGVPSFGSEGDQLSVTFIFVLPQDSVNKTVEFQFQEIQIPFLVR